MAIEGTDKDGKPFGGNMLNTIGGEHDIHVGGSHYTQVEKDYELTVKGDVQADLKGDVSIAMNSLVIEATQKITPKVGASFIVIDPCEVHLNGCNVYKTPSGSADGAASVTLQNIADVTAREPGDKSNQRLTPCHAALGSGGSRGTHGDSPTPAPSALHRGSVNCNFLPPAGTSFPSGSGSGSSDAGGGGPANAG